MRKTFVLAILLLLVAIPALFAQYEESGPDYTTTLMKKGDARIQAFEQYIRKYPDTNQCAFTKYAYYWLAYDYYNAKNFGEAIKNGEKFVAFGGMDKKLEAGAYLILANAYGVQGPRYSQEKALRMADKALSVAKEGGLNDIVKDAQNAKNVLSGAAAPAKPARAATPVQKIGVAYQAKKWDEVVSIYNSFSEADKQSDPLVFEAYVRAMIKLGRVDAALKDLGDSYARARKAITAERIGKIYLEKADKEKRYLDTAIDYYIEAGLLFGKENNASRKDAAYKIAKYQLFEKYGYNEKANKVNAQVKNQPKPVDNTKQIEKLQADYARLEQQLSLKYGDMEMPAYEQDKLDKIAREIKALQSNKPKPPDAKTAEEAAALEKERVRIEAEFNTLVEKARKKLGL